MLTRGAVHAGSGAGAGGAVRHGAAGVVCRRDQHVQPGQRPGPHGQGGPHGPPPHIGREEVPARAPGRVPRARPRRPHRQPAPGHRARAAGGRPGGLGHRSSEGRCLRGAGCGARPGPGRPGRRARTGGPAGAGGGAADGGRLGAGGAQGRRRARRCGNVGAGSRGAHGGAGERGGALQSAQLQQGEPTQSPAQ